MDCCMSCNVTEAAAAAGGGGGAGFGGTGGVDGAFELVPGNIVQPSE